MTMQDRGPIDEMEKKPVLSTDSDKNYLIEIDGQKRKIKAFVMLVEVPENENKIEGFTLANIGEAIIMKNHLGDAVRSMKGTLIAQSLGLDPSQVNVIDLDDTIDGVVADISIPGTFNQDLN